MACPRHHSTRGQNTNYNDLAPVKIAFQMTVVCFSDGEDNISLAIHREKLPSYMWQSEEGMTCSGTNGTQVRDTAFTVLAVPQAVWRTVIISSRRWLKCLNFLTFRSSGGIFPTLTVSSDNEDSLSAQRTMATFCLTALLSPLKQSCFFGRMVGSRRRLHFDVTDIKNLFPKNHRGLTSFRQRWCLITHAE